MRVLVVGSGGREHALAWAISASVLCDELYAAPGNAGIAEVATCVPIQAEDIDGICAFARDKKIDLVVVGAEVPLCNGLVDKLEAQGTPAFGPTAAAAALEGSKGFTKDLCAKYDIPTAAYGRFKAIDPAIKFIRERGAPIVVKADGLAAGKGVIIASTVPEAEAAVRDILGGSFGKAGAEVVVEEFLDGEEASVFALVDGTHALPLASAQDHKRAFDGDAGPNTGGMGAYSPAPIVTDAMLADVMKRIIEPTVAAMADMKRPFKGVLFAGLMIDKQGPKLLEYNVRFGDPECQVLMMRLKSDILPALLAARDGRLDTVDLRWHDDAALTVVMAAKGYPGTYAKNTVIEGVEDAAKVEGVTVFHAGTKRDDGKLLATGGRVLDVTATGRTVAEAQTRAYEAVDRIRWPEGFCRRDIGWRAIARAKS
jgi:phosphoribosylamine--glycine ligase